MTVLKWSVGVLAILNIILLLNTWRSPGHQMHPGPPMHHGGGGPAKMIIEELKLSPDQIKLFEALKEAHHSSMLELQEKGRELRKTYFDQLKMETPDQKIVDELATAISTNQKAIETVTFEHFKEVRKICNEEQKKHFDAIIGDIIRGMAGPNRPGGPPPH